jgi:hypothetical protein
MGAHEWCFYGWREGAAHQFFGPANATDLWSIKKVNPQHMIHLTEKPVALAVRAIQYSSQVGENVLDLFGGSGSTLIANEPFEHDRYIMAPCCEPAGLAEYQPITILLIAAADLALFDEWPVCREVEVEHGTDGARILTLMEMARRFKEEQAELAELRQAGKRTR